ncbi:hypothetical protein LU699_13060 [Luteimonas fraxinea]|uniref:Uncharacterized protein n=1 Tax=Luteimonas fraxinea TaxID=2901869 RepID=A0ABS8UGU3_9GAMM|nr:hypothetical protein [Luteimonas fraxinea]MCD9098057.1 hypothetical protein [Luteimonas fraxinea]UHH09218.1 hypothetical protein LU699_13060 [Luteimonas fraxinea]
MAVLDGCEAHAIIAIESGIVIIIFLCIFEILSWIDSKLLDREMLDIEER